jgi:hypothetical protein
MEKKQQLAQKLDKKKGKPFGLPFFTTNLASLTVLIKPP